MRARDPHEIDMALLANVEKHPKDLTRVVAGLLGVSRQAVATHIRDLVAEGYLSKSGTTRPTYAPGRYRRASFRYPLAGLAEDRVWSRDISPLLHGLTREVFDICHFGLTEMVNNAIDHSEGAYVGVHVLRDQKQVAIAIVDDGVGIFRKISAALSLPDERLALLELSKGKFTTDPTRHSGEGVFFTSRMFDHYQIVSGGLIFDHLDHEPDDLLFDVDSDHSGTSVSMRIFIASQRSMRDTYAKYSSGPDEHTFAKTIVPVRMAKIGEENLVSRSQAKRLLQRIDRFRCVVFDFDHVPNVGQAFADEIFRVFANAHPGIELIAVHTAPDVQQMIRRAEVLRDEQSGQLSQVKREPK